MEISHRDTEKRRRDAEAQFEKIRIDVEREVLQLQFEAGVTAAKAQLLEMAEGLQIIDEAIAAEPENTKFELTREYLCSRNILKQSDNSPHSPVADLSRMELDKSIITWWSPTLQSLGNPETEFKMMMMMYAYLHQ